jgi:hypothetical protein
VRIQICEVDSVRSTAKTAEWWSAGRDLRGTWRTINESLENNAIKKPKLSLSHRLSLRVNRPRK